MRSFEFCFDGVEQGATVAVSTSYRKNDEESFLLGYNGMLDVIQPSQILCYDEPFRAMRGNVREFLPTAYEWTKDLDWKEKAKFLFEKHTRKFI